MQISGGARRFEVSLRVRQLTTEQNALGVALNKASTDRVAFAPEKSALARAAMFGFQHKLTRAYKWVGNYQLSS